LSSRRAKQVKRIVKRWNFCRPDEDDLGNLSNSALDQMSDAAAHATISLGMSTEIINGKPGKGNFNVPPFPEPRPEKVAN
jgi:hypothetical protein